MNDILSLLGGGTASGGFSMLLKAIGAAMRGEDPATFMRSIANNHPALKQVDFNDLYGSAQKLCKHKGWAGNRSPSSYMEEQLWI